MWKIIYERMALSSVFCLLHLCCALLLLMGLGVASAVSAASAATVAGRSDTVASVYVFPKHELDFGVFDQQLMDFYVHQYVTYPYLPIFWEGKARAQFGLIGLYERNFFHTRKHFSLNYGVSLGYWRSHVLNQTVTTAAIYLALRLWFINSPGLRVYFTYSAAGPCMLSRQVIDYVDMGSHFTFQDYLGFGALIGRRHVVNVMFRIFHFSNGLLVPKDPGFDVPWVLSVGFAFGV